MYDTDKKICWNTNVCESKSNLKDDCFLSVVWTVTFKDTHILWRPFLKSADDKCHPPEWSKIEHVRTYDILSFRLCSNGISKCLNYHKEIWESVKNFSSSMKSKTKWVSLLLTVYKSSGYPVGTLSDFFYWLDFVSPIPSFFGAVIIFCWIFSYVL